MSGGDCKANLNFLKRKKCLRELFESVYCVCSVVNHELVSKTQKFKIFLKESLLFGFFLTSPAVYSEFEGRYTVPILHVVSVTQTVFAPAAHCHWHSHEEFGTDTTTWGGGPHVDLF